MEDIQLRIMNSAMELIKEKGYTATTTKDIASLAGVNECTIFRKFKNKKEIVLSALELDFWKPKISKETFSQLSWELETDLKMFARQYLKFVTTDSVKLSIGLREPMIYAESADKIMRIPETFAAALQEYLKQMYERGKIKEANFECLAIMFLSINFGFIFFKASFEDRLTSIRNEEYIEQCVTSFVSGIEK